ncbi:helix-turn-helix transcriptional regulator [Mycobacterium colombiense]|uniref:Helix-turn-helix transcriptional regulator n=1 Tax=Mycobacterium colombiense TaxID=339268 RepID=A0A853M295_9MYCO|nr:LuxR family transcriptional regulator [Mycobacterium colombiense]OBJ15962.1 helix-turn-helix transcriptional regulator [Mycobacterium colombiense]OBJ18677.1 helix-turn-helix transcriptional regulator [Mycobacterium colombiense]OBJ61494.1 helix-turn-helix transcriptional regulator [Mycobacterium colombiense]
MVTVEDFSRLVSGIYAAAVTPRHWELALRDIHHALGGTVGTLSEAAGRAWSIQATTAPADAGKTYAEHYCRLDYVLAGVENGPVGAVRTGTELRAARTNTEFYNDWMLPNDLGDGLFVRLTGGQRLSCLIVAAPRRTLPFDTPERVQLMGRLVPHLQQALSTRQKLTALADSAVELAGALEVVRHGIVIVAGEHLVINLNSAAERILSVQDGLRMRSGRIAATSMHAEQELHCAIHNALADERYTVRGGMTVLCIRPSGKRPYVLHVLPSHRVDADEPPSRPLALVLIIDPEDEPEPAVALLRRLYRLTEAEAEVALRVMHGVDLKQISEELSVSLTTVRTHLQHVFDKTDTHRQAELVRLLLVLSP